MNNTQIICAICLDPFDEDSAAYDDGKMAMCQPCADKIDAKRYRYLRARDLDTIHKGGIFAGMTPDNSVLSGKELDIAIDNFIRGES